MLSVGPNMGATLSRQRAQQEADLAAARKAGTAHPAVDADGNPINPHIPDYISKVPFWAKTGEGASLNHQRVRKEEDRSHTKLDEYADRGAKVGPAAKKFRKGACENCGAMTHKRQDCVERPRKRGAKFSGQNIMADEVVHEFKGDYDAKRDRWAGYDNKAFKNLIDDYEATEQARQKNREEEIDAQTSTDQGVENKVAKAKQDEDDDFGSSDDEDEDEDKYADAADQVGQKLDTKTRITVRNLRIREDTAKYLMNLDAESAYYDPKTRAMRDAPEANANPEDLKFAGDNFLRYSGEATNMQKLQLFAWQSSQRGHNVHAQANPTAGEMLLKELDKKKEVLKDTSKVSILSKYGGEEYLERLPKELLGGQTEEYVEYSRTGELLKGREKAKARSKYDEDVYINNHTAVWGSWFDREAGSWGFACCHSLISGSYCTGEAGKNANASSSAAALLEAASSRQKVDAAAEDERRSLVERKAADKAGSKGRAREAPALGRRPGDAIEGDLDEDRLKRAMEDERKRKNMGDDEAWAQTKKSKTDVTEEEMEAYRRSKLAFDDPMANYKDIGE